MPKFQHTHILDFKPAQYYDGKNCYVQFRVFHPIEKRWIPKRHKCNHVKGKAARKRYANKLVQELNTKLYAGWNPFIDEEAPNGYRLLREAIDHFINSKERELKPHSMRSYRSFARTLNQWMTFYSDDAEMFAVSFDKTCALRLLAFIEEIKGVSPKTYNNYLTCYRAMWTWFVQHQYSVLNPFTGIPKRKTGEKSKIVIPAEDRMRIERYLKKHDPTYLLCCRMLFFCLIRPNELTHLTPDDIYLENSTIYISPEASKNGKGEYVTIPDIMMREIREHLDSLDCESVDYLFSDSRTLRPGKERMDPRIFSKRWDKLRQVLKLPIEMKMYSLKDSGIIQLLQDGVSPDEVMRQARHSDLGMTTVYLRHVHKSASEQVKTKAKGW